MSPEKLREIKINKNYLRIVREGMWGVVNNEVSGSAHHTYNPDTGEITTKWPLSNPDGEDKIEKKHAGKTGTAEFGEVNEDGTYSQQHAWYTAFAPYDNPEVVVTVFLEDGGEGTSYAVPVADRAIRAYYELTGKRGFAGWCSARTSSRSASSTRFPTPTRSSWSRARWSPKRRINR